MLFAMVTYDAPFAGVPTPMCKTPPTEELEKLTTWYLGNTTVEDRYEQHS